MVFLFLFVQPNSVDQITGADMPEACMPISAVHRNQIVVLWQLCTSNEAFTQY